MIGYAAALLAGITLGLIGGGGSILIVPVLVYLMDYDPVMATAYSLFVVGISSAVGAVSYMKRGLLSYKTAAIFAIPSFLAVFITRKFLMPAIPETVISFGDVDITTDLIFFLIMIVVFLGTALLVFNYAIKSRANHIRPDWRRFSKVFLLVIPAVIAVFVMRQFVIPNIPHELLVIGGITITKGTVIMVIFSIVMFFSGLNMVRKKKKLVDKDSGAELAKPVIVLQGLLVGLVTGIVGAGGGFLIVPALVLLARLPMKLAVGTSLLIISVQSLIGFLGDVSQKNIDWGFLLPFAGSSIIGIVIGTFLSSKVSGEKLKTGFGWFVIGMATIIIIKETI